MSVTKESDNNMQDYNITSIWERNQLYINKMKKYFTTYALVLISLSQNQHIFPYRSNFLPQALLNDLGQNIKATT